MVNSQQRIKVIKVPLENRPPSYQQSFTYMPRMYLELLENKDKIKPSIINKDYSPPREKPSHGIENENVSNANTGINNDYNTYYDHEKHRQGNHGHSKYKSSENKSISSLSDSDSVGSYKSDKNKSEFSSSGVSRSSSQDQTSESGLEELAADRSTDISSVSNLSSDGSKRHKKRRNKKYSAHRDRHGYSISRKNKIDPPSLAELKASGSYVPKSAYANLSSHTSNLTEQQQEDAKRELLFKFKLLKKSYPLAELPEYTIHSDYEIMVKAYEDSVRQLSLDATVDNYKTYLVYAFAGCEFLFGNFLGFDMQGFTQQQIISMKSYEKLLIELGEKSYVPTGSKWPVEVRLLSMVIMNAAFFIMSKIIMKKSGANLLNLVNNMSGISPIANNGNHTPKSSKPMKRPNINLDSIPELI